MFCIYYHGDLSFLFNQMVMKYVNIKVTERFSILSDYNLDEAEPGLLIKRKSVLK